MQGPPEAESIGYEELRSLVIEALARPTDDGWQFNRLKSAVAMVAVQQGRATESQQPNVKGLNVVHDPSGPHRLTGRDGARVESIAWDLIIEGIVRPGLGDGQNDSLPFFHITERGKVVLKEGPQSPYDPDGYMKRLRHDVPTLDPIILTYLNESLHTFRIGCLLSSTIALGCASEKALLLLVAGYADSLQPEPKARFKKDTDGQGIKRQFDVLRKMLDSELRGRLPKELSDSLDVELNGLFDFIRNQRNEAGHPTGKLVERERAYANLVVFPVYLRKVYALMDWVRANRKP